MSHISNTTINFKAIESLDSDGDGVTNIDEITAGTKPGDATSKPPSGGGTTDTTKPTVSSTSPSSSATGVAVTSTITATFSEAMDSSTITTTTFKLNNSVTGTVSYDSTTMTATFTPTGSLTASTTYTVTITTGVKDSAGNAMAANKTWTFTTATAAVSDTTPPTVSSTSPASGATGVITSSVITATFSEAMDSSTITSSTFTINGVTGNVTYNSSSKTATFTPSGSLTADTTYTATITTGVKDSAGNALAAAKTWTFTTASSSSGGTTDTTKPTVISTSPVDGATDVDVNSAITVTFSEAMNQSTINDNFKLNFGVTGLITYDSATNTATFTPTASLQADKTYKVTITTGVKDSSGNTMSTQFEWSFTTASSTTSDTTPPTVSVFVVPDASKSFKIDITTLTAIDDTGVTGYMINESPDAPSAKVKKGWSLPEPKTYALKNKKAGTKTLYAWAKDAAGNVSEGMSVKVVFDNQPPKAPTGLTAVADSSSSVSLSWDASTDKPDTDNSGISGYIVLRNNKTITVTEDTSYTDTDVSPSKKYKYTVKAKDAAGNTSAASKAVSVKTPAESPALSSHVNDMPVPVGKHVMGYDPAAQPVIIKDPASAMPIGVETFMKNGLSEVMLGTPKFSEEVDMYVVLYNSADLADNIQVLGPDDGFEYVEVPETLGTVDADIFAKSISEYGLTPWKTTGGPLEESVSVALKALDLSPGTYQIGLLVTPKGDLGNYYLWVTGFSIK